jgi:hypothetical protein
MGWHRLRALRVAGALRLAGYLLCAALVGLASALAAEIALIVLWGLLERVLTAWYF